MDTAIDLRFLAIWQYLLMAPALTLLAPKITDLSSRKLSFTEGKP